MKPIRSDLQHDVVQDPWSGADRPAQSQDTFHGLSSSGCLESQTVRRQVAAGCGCLRPAGGFCAVCADGSTACVDCFGHCDRCHKPLCTMHSFFSGGSAEVPSTRLCRPCHEAARRKAMARRVARFLLASFVMFEKHP